MESPCPETLETAPMSLSQVCRSPGLVRGFGGDGQWLLLTIATGLAMAAFGLKRRYRV